MDTHTILNTSQHFKDGNEKMKILQKIGRDADNGFAKFKLNQNPKCISI